MTITIFDSTSCELGEGPTYDAPQDKAWWFDIAGRALFEHDFASATTTRQDLPFMASMLGVVDEWTQLVAGEGGLYIRELLDGRVTMHHPLEAGKPHMRSNDGRVHPSGALWIGTMGKKAEAGAGAIYWFFKGQLKTLYSDISIPNAICFSPDGTVAYFADTRTGKIMAVDTDPADGQLASEPRVHYDYGTRRSGVDGAVTDADGNIWNAVWGAGMIQQISPQGQLLRTIDVPARQPSCPCFVGRDLDRLLVTTACENMDEAARAADPNAGRTLLLDVGARGKPEPRIVL